MSNYSYHFNKDFLLPARIETLDTNIAPLKLDIFRPLMRSELDTLDDYWTAYQRFNQKAFSGDYRELSISVNIDGRAVAQLRCCTSVLDNGEVLWCADLSRSRHQSIYSEKLDIYSYSDTHLSSLLVLEVNAQMFGRAGQKNAVNI